MKLLPGGPVAPSMLLVVACGICLVYLVSLSLTRTCSGLSTAARTGDSQSFKPEAKHSFYGEAPLGGGWRETKSGGKLGVLDNADGLELYN